MKKHSYYNFEGYLNTVSLRRDRILSDEYLVRTIKNHQNNIRQLKNSIDNSKNEVSKKTLSLSNRNNNTSSIFPPISVSKIATSSDTLTMIFSLRDNNNKKIYSGFNFNEKFNDVLIKRKNSDISLNKSFNSSFTKRTIIQDNVKLRHRIIKAKSPLNKNKIFKVYDSQTKPVLKRIKKVFPNKIINQQMGTLHSKMSILNLK